MLECVCHLPLLDCGLLPCLLCCATEVDCVVCFGSAACQVALVVLAVLQVSVMLHDAVMVGLVVLNIPKRFIWW